VVGLPSVCAAIRARFPGEIGERNAAAAGAAYTHVGKTLAALSHA
jgi:Pyruvate/2-oxoacid:ferredoxin oxidoreductase gamma subunit